MPYTKTTWINNNEPPISAQNLNKMEQGIYDNSVAVESATSLLGGHYVQKDVPANAVFTDTIYDDTEITERMTTAESDIEDLQESTEHLSDGDTVYPYASEIEIEDALGVNAKDVSVKIEPVQDLHGYEHPWAGGAGKNLLVPPMELGTIVADGNNGNSNTDMRSKNFTPVTSGATYTYSQKTASGGQIWANYYNNGTFVSRVYVGGAVRSATFTVPDGVNQVRMRVSLAEESVLIDENQLESGSTATTFAPYENICPISGFTEASILDHGKNLVSSIESGSWSSTGANAINNERLRTVDFISVEGGKTYTVSATNGKQVYIASWEKNDYSADYLSVSNWQNSPYTVTLPSNAHYAKVMVRNSNNATIQPSDTSLQMEHGSTPTTYEPYTAHTATIQLGDTIYGGTVNATTGAMTVDRGYAEFDGSVDEQIFIVDNYRRAKILYSNVKTYDGTSISSMKCDKLKTITNNGTYMGNVGISQDTDMLFVADGTNNMNANDFREWLSNNPIHVAFELATPITIQLTPQQIQLLDGYNLMSANTGDISITTTDIKGAIGQADELIEANTQAIREIDSLNDSIFGTIENGTTAIKAYAQGDYFVKDKKMCKALTSIAQGATFTLGTNYAQYTLAEILKAIEQS